MVRIDNIRNHMSQIVINLFNYVHLPTSNLDYERKSIYLDTVSNKLQLFDKEIQGDFSKLIKSIEKDIKEKSLKLSNEDMELSGRTKQIHIILEQNEEFIQLRTELDKLNLGTGFLKKTEKKKREIISRMSEIKSEIAQKIPLDIDDLSMLEKLIYTTNTPISFTHKSGEDGWYVTESDSYNNIKGMIW